MPSPFAEMFAAARHESGLEIRQLAKRTGFTDGFVRQNEEIAKNPAASTLFKYARALDLKVTIDRNGITVESGQGTIYFKDWNPLDEETGLEYISKPSD